MQRWTLEMARDAYEKTGLEPARGYFIGYTGKTPTSACFVGALHYSKFGEDFGDSYVSDLVGDEGEDIDYCWGVIHGWDGMPITPQSDAVRLGVEDGKAIAKAIFGEE